MTIGGLVGFYLGPIGVIPFAIPFGIIGGGAQVMIVFPVMV